MPIGMFKSAVFGDMNDFGMCQAFYLGHFLYDFHAQGVTLKGKALATRCLFPNYSQLLDIFTQLLLKTAEKFIMPSVIGNIGLSFIKLNLFRQIYPE